MKNISRFRISLFFAFLLVLNPLYAEDTVEFLNGSTATGTIKEISKQKKEFVFESKFGGRIVARKYPYSRVHAVTFKGKRYELTPRLLADSTERSEQEVLDIIERAGTKDPDWFQDTPLNYPKKLDLSWPLKPATEGWNVNRNVIHYLYSTIHENPPRYRSGIKLVHHCMSLHSDQKLLDRDMERLGAMYFELVKDYPRSAYWYRQIEPSVSKVGGIHLAECYWKLGNQEMALELLRGKWLHVSAITLLGKMGQIEDAEKVAKAYIQRQRPVEASLLCGDVLREAGKFDDAIKYYRRVANAKFEKDSEHRFKGRALDSIEAIQVYEQTDVSKIDDGTYHAHAMGYGGKLELEIRVQNGRIKLVKPGKHQEKRHYEAMSIIPRQIVELQSVQGIDAVSGATVTSRAILNASAKALATGARK